MFDSHCHLHDDRMAQVRDRALRDARRAGVHGLLLAGVDPPGWRIAAQLAAADERRDLHVAYGVHPQVVADSSEDQVTELLQALAATLAGRGPGPPWQAAALGETGLDALGDARQPTLPRQVRAFTEQLELARRHCLPVVLHILRAHDRALQVLRAQGPLPAGGVVHSYSGGAAHVHHYLDLGLHLSFAGPVTYPDAHRVHQALRAVPAERLLIETDAPDQTPYPQRQQARCNEPAFLVTIAQRVATIRGEPVELVQRYTTDNARRLYRLPALAQEHPRP